LSEKLNPLGAFYPTDIHLHSLIFEFFHQILTLPYRFYSTADPEELTSLDEYISRMKADQDTILYLPGDSKEAILKSPILKKYQKLGYEVLLLGDPIDEFCVQHLSEYEKRKVKSIAKDDVNIIDGSDEISKKKL
jgi:molecular chaperone HtpG